MTQNTANAVELIQNRIVGHGDVKPEELLANPLNFRRHPGNQMEALRGSMKELGWIKTILVNKTTGHVIDGHARVEEAMRQGLPTIPGTVVELTEDEERLALALLDPITEMAISDSLMLEALLAEVHTEDPALQSLLDQLRDTTTDNGIAEIPADLSDRPMLFNAIQIAEQIELAWPMPQNGEEVAAGLMTPAMAMGQFNKLSRGGKTGYWISTLFNPHRITCETSKKSHFVKSCNEKAKFRQIGLRWMAEKYEGDVHPSQFIKYAGPGWGGQGMVYEFQPNIARDIYLQYCPAGGRALDPCHGWGGRVIGWLAANLGGHYVGFDPATQTAEGWEKMVEFLKQSATTSTAENFCIPFEDSILEPESFDFALTSPPYYDTEKYAPGDATQSHNRYTTFESWVEGFYRPFLLKTMAALKPGAYFVLNVGNRQFPLSDIAKGIAQDEKWAITRDEGKYVIGRAALEADGGEVDTEGNEDFLILRKSPR